MEQVSKPTCNKVQTRFSVFETNSSSSHSLTLPDPSALRQSFPAEILRKGVARIQLGEYHWEYYRYYTLYSKIQYLVTQLSGGEVPFEFTDTLEGARAYCEENSNFAMLFEVVKEQTGCELVIESGQGSIDHQSALSDAATGMELFENKDLLANFLTDPNAYIQTGNDNSEPPLIIETDRGEEPYYAKFIAEPEAGAVAVTLNTDKFHDFNILRTKKGAWLSSAVNEALFEEVLQSGILLSAQQTVEKTSNAFYDSGSSSDEVARELLSSLLEDKLFHRTVAGFTGTSVTKIVPAPTYKRYFNITLWVSQELAEKLEDLGAEPDGWSQILRGVRLLEYAKGSQYEEARRDELDKLLDSSVADGLFS